LIFSFFVFIFLIIFQIFNILFSGQPRYWEIVHEKNFEKINIDREKIVQLKRKRINLPYISVLDEKYTQLGYQGSIKNGLCGAVENGNIELFYQTDIYGFRENINERYIKSDFVLLGDSFTNSTCENKPNDLKSNLLETTNNTYLNLGRNGTDYAEQFLIFSHYLKNTEFKGVIWFFYEGNDYEQKSYNVTKPNNYKLLLDDDINYEINLNHDISFLFRFKVWIAEYIRGTSVVLKFFKKYSDLLDKKDYELVHKNMSNFLDQKNIKQRYLVYIPSWQKISLYKLKNLNLYDKHPQVSQLNSLKKNVEEVSKKYGFKFIDTDDYFFQLKNPLSIYHYKLNTHFNSKGYKILSKAVSDNLSD